MMCVFGINRQYIDINKVKDVIFIGSNFYLLFQPEPSAGDLLLCDDQLPVGHSCCYTLHTPQA